MVSSRERCIRAIEHRIPDRVPLILRIRPEPLSRLMKELRAKDYREVIDALGVDIVGTGIGLKGGFEPEGEVLWKEGGFVVKKLEGGKEIRRSIFGYETIWAPDHTHTYTFYSHPLKSMRLEEYPWPEVCHEDYDRVVEFRREYEDYFIYGGVVQCFETAWKLAGFNEFMRMIIRDAGRAKRILDGLYRIAEEQARLLLDAGVDAIVNGDDVGMQRGMIISPKLWRGMLKPLYSRLINLVHRRGAFFVFHSDGWIEPIIPDLVDLGVDVLTPVQPECMDVYDLKEKYGEELCFDGTISIQRTMPFGSVRDVELEVRERIERLGPTGLILGPGHNLQPEVPVSNILALYRAAKKYGRIRGL